jgi:hypothetical protein
LERNWRVIPRNRGSGTGTENDTDISQALEEWLKIIDEEKARKVDHQAIATQTRQERDTVSTWRTDLVRRQRERLPVVTLELPSDDEYIDVSDDEDTVSVEVIDKR